MAVVVELKVRVKVGTLNSAVVTQCGRMGALMQSSLNSSVHNQRCSGTRARATPRLVYMRVSRLGVRTGRQYLRHTMARRSW
jgi:hypothetical protein